MNNRILDKIKQTRVASGISARRLGILSDLSVTSIAKFERGNMPSMASLAKILDALDLHIDKKAFAKLLKDKRKSLNATLKKIARIAGVSHTTIYNIEHSFFPSIKICCVIAKELDIPLDKIIKWPKKSLKDK